MTDEAGRTPLFEAVTVGDAAAVRAFLAAGWRYDHRAESGWTTLLLATRDGSDPAVVTELLAAGADPSATADEARWRDALWCARRNDDMQGSEALVGLIAAYLLRAPVPSAPSAPVQVLTEGSASYLPPSAAPVTVEAVVLEGTMRVRGAVSGVAEVGSTRGRHQEEPQLQVTFEIVHWSLPFVLAGWPHVVTVICSQEVEVTASGASEIADDLARDRCSAST